MIELPAWANYRPDWLECKHECPKCKCKVECNPESCTGNKQMYCGEHTLLRQSVKQGVVNMAISPAGGPFKPYGSSPQSFQNAQQYQNQLQNAAAGMPSSIQGTISSNTLGLANQLGQNAAATISIGSLNNLSGLLSGTTATSTLSGAGSTLSGNGSGFIVTPGGTITVPANSGNILITNSGSTISIGSGGWASTVVTKTIKTVDRDKVAKLANVEPRKIADRIPDSIAPITAWRGWQVTGELGLKSLGVSHVWEPKKPLKAFCIHNKNHHQPIKMCTCGAWGFKTRDGLLDALKGYEVNVIGTVAMWGTVIETENGFRAEYAYPTELWLLDDGLEEISRIYNVPIRSL